MTEKILQIVGRLLVSAEEFERENGPESARAFADLPGLRWKIALLDREHGEAGGIYLFADEASHDAYVNGPIVAQLRQFPAWTDVQVRSFDYMRAFSEVTRAPIGDQFTLDTPRALTFGRMVETALASVPAIKPADARQRMETEPDLLLIDVRDAADIAQTGTVPGAANISYGALTYMADAEVPEDWRDPRLADRERPIITTCILGPLGALGGKLLHDMGFNNVSILDGGVMAWQGAGFPLQPTVN